MAAGQDPTKLQAPGLLEEDGHDLPISPDRPVIHDRLQAVLQSAPVGPGHSLLRERISDGDLFCPIYPTQGTDTTDFGATLMALFNITPFLNFLEEAVNKKAFNDPFIEGLHALAQSFRGWQAVEKTREEQLEAVEARKRLVWECIETERAGQPAPILIEEVPVPDFINYLFQRIETAELRHGQAGGDDVDLSIRFKQLFKRFNVRHTPMRCDCAQPVLRRQATTDPQRPVSGYILNTEVPKTMNLDQGISVAMWEKLGRRRICPVCDKSPEPAHDFDKFAYLPEVLFIRTSFVDNSGGPGNRRSTVGEKLTYPERLDMSAFRDDPTRPGDQSDCIYRLQSIILDNPQNDRASKAALRVLDDKFAQFEYADEPNTYPVIISFNKVNEASNGVPDLLIYVRERHADAVDNAPDTVKPKPTGPPGGTAEVATPTPSQPKPEVKPPTGTSDASEYDEDTYNIQRFINAQDEPDGHVTPYYSATLDMTFGNTFAAASQWMWCCFPMCPGVDLKEEPLPWPSYESELRNILGSSYTIRSLGEARAYWNHPLLRERYHELVQIVRNGAQSDLDILFGSEANVIHFLASLTLFFFIMNRDDRENRELFTDVFLRFKRSLHADSLYQVARWLGDDGDKEGTAEVLAFLDDSGEQETTRHLQGGPSTGPTGTGPIAPPSTDNKTGRSESADKGAHGKGPGNSNRHDFAQRIGSKLLSLADQDFDVPKSKFDGEHQFWEFENTSRGVGRAIMSFGLPESAATPVLTPEMKEKAHRLGRHILSLTWHEDDPSPDNAAGTSSLSRPVGSFGLDGSSDEPGDGADLEDDLFNAVAIPTDPRDPRIAACQNWTLEELKREFQKEQLDWRGLRTDPEKHRTKFRKHFELERDYSIYHEGRLRQAIEDRGIRLRHVINKGDKVDKAELVDALTNYDAQRLQEADYVDGDEPEDTESVVYGSEPYQSSEASGTEAKYVAMERAALAANGKAEATPLYPRVVAAAARAQKRPRDEDDEYEDEDDENDDDEPVPRVPTKSPVRPRTRY